MLNDSRLGIERLALVTTVMWMALLVFSPGTPAAESPVIFPLPQEIEEHGNHFVLDEQVAIVIPESARDNDRSLARFLSAELAERHGLGLRTVNVGQLPPDKRFILMGSISNPLIREYIASKHLQIDADSPGPEGYVLEVSRDSVVIAGSDDQGAFYGLQSLRQVIENADGTLRVRGVHVKDWPYKPFRAIRLYVPGRENIAFFKRFLRDFMALYKFNKVVMEMNAVMRFDTHPELNAGWIEFAKDLDYTRRDRPLGPGQQYQDSAHHDAGDGGLLEKEEVADLVEYANRHFIEVIPELASLTHSYYLLTRHRELAEIQEAEWPDTYCPLRPESYELLFDVFDEYVEVMQPKLVHIGHDEWRMPTGICRVCKGKDSKALFIEDVLRIYDYFDAKGIKIGMWGDHFMQGVRGEGLRERVTSTGYTYFMPGALTPIQVEELIPKDVLIFNWFWNERKDVGINNNGREEFEKEVAEFGFKQVYGNFQPFMRNYARRSARPDVQGGAPSSWAATTEFNIGKDLMFDFLGCANVLWSTHWPEQDRLLRITQSLMPEVRRNLSGKTLPSQDGDAVVPVDLAPFFNASTHQRILDADLKGLKTGEVGTDGKTFHLPKPGLYNGRCAIAVGVQGEEEGSLAGTAEGIPIGKDVSSLIFLHACARPARNEMSYRYIYNFADTADLLGWYEVVYEDGFVETVPIRYGVNILEWTPWIEPTSSVYCYAGDPVLCSNLEEDDAKYFFAYEWENPRLGKVVKEVRLKGSTGFEGYKGKPISENAVALLGLSVVEKRSDLQAVTAK